MVGVTWGGVVGVGCGGVVLLSAAGSVCGAGRWLFLSLVRVPVWRVCGGVGVVVDCLIARVDDDVRPALWGRAGLAFCFLWGVGLFFWACCWAVCIFLWRV